MNDHDLLANSLIYLGAAVVAVPFAKRLGLGSVLGYLIAGVAIGPWGLALISNSRDILHFAEFGVVLLLFLIGLELNPKRLWSMRRPIFGIGSIQVIATAVIIFAICSLLGLPWGSALIIAMGLSLSSTAIALQSLKERNQLSTPTGQSVFSILLFQDIAVIPMLTLIPLLGSNMGESSEPLLEALKVIAVIGAIIIGGHFLIRPIFRFIAATRLREIFTAFSLLLVIGIALLMDAVGMSMALGTFLAGVLLAESEYRHELEIEIEPFKGLLLGLFFISIGMTIDFGLLLEKPWLIIALVLGLLLVKLAVLIAIARTEKLPASQQGLFACLLGQGGEFAFVLFTAAVAANALEQQWASLLFVVVAFSMMATPLLLLLNERFIEPRFLHLGGQQPADTIEDPDNPVIIAGFGRFGRTVGRLLHANRITTTILDHNPDQIEDARRFGYRVYYGDASRLDMLHSAGADRARLLIITVDDPEKVLAIADLAQQHFPQLTILARARGMATAMEFLKRDIPLFRREIQESALLLGEDALKQLGYGAFQAKQMAHIFRDHEEALLQKMYQTDALDKRIHISRMARKELAQILEADEQEQQNLRDHSWHER
ncbi:MAG: glutathione-regulated potassium-efflux system protein KefC [Candidatus Polarisedimenticolaceae bacterium]|nr:glutathione-regulated potassium-efflux system protein KefC [Candidatus Polarisedimenticolaceae bacterium]